VGVIQGGIVLQAARQVFDDTHCRPDRASPERAFRWEYWNAGALYLWLCC
jgi:hypothetical protein